MVNYPIHVSILASILQEQNHPWMNFFSNVSSSSTYSVNLYVMQPLACTGEVEYADRVGCLYPHGAPHIDSMEIGEGRGRKPSSRTVLALCSRIG